MHERLGLQEATLGFDGLMVLKRSTRRTSVVISRAGSVPGKLSVTSTKEATATGHKVTTVVTEA